MTIILDQRVILFHKHSSSARVRFLYFVERESVLGFESLPALASLIEQPSSSFDETASRRIVTDYFDQLDDEQIVFDDTFYCEADIPGKTVGVSLGRFTHIDPPFEMARTRGAEFREITGVRAVPSVELEILQRAYAQIMG